MRKHLLERLAVQVLYIGPLFWFIELLQNQFFRLVQHGTWGWEYPNSLSCGPSPGMTAHRWFCFKSIGLWCTSVAMFWLLEVLWFKRKQTPFWLRALIAGTLGWAGEFTAGWVSYKVFGVYLQRWNDSNLEFVKLIALPFWWSNYLVFHLLSARLGDRVPRGADQRWAERGAEAVPVSPTIPTVAAPKAG
jgi:hypothetical protein